MIPSVSSKEIVTTHLFGFPELVCVSLSGTAVLTDGNTFDREKNISAWSINYEIIAIK